MPPDDKKKIIIIIIIKIPKKIVIASWGVIWFKHYTKYSLYTKEKNEKMWFVVTFLHVYTGSYFLDTGTHVYNKNVKNAEKTKTNDHV